jgi:hypothetical protein
MFRVAGSVTETCHNVVSHRPLIVKHLESYSHVVYLLKNIGDSPTQGIGCAAMSDPWEHG